MLAFVRGMVQFYAALLDLDGIVDRARTRSAHRRP